MRRYLELAIALVLGALAWPTIHGIVSPASAANPICGSSSAPCYVALVTCDASDPDDCTYGRTSDEWHLVQSLR